jgi:hypothetical protein
VAPHQTSPGAETMDLYFQLCVMGSVLVMILEEWWGR